MNDLCCIPDIPVLNKNIIYMYVEQIRSVYTTLFRRSTLC